MRIKLDGILFDSKITFQRTSRNFITLKILNWTFRLVPKNKKSFRRTIGTGFASLLGTKLMKHYTFFARPLITIVIAPSKRHTNGGSVHT